MNISRIIVLTLMIVLQGCSSLSVKPNNSLDAEMLNEWEVEGDLTLKHEGTKESAHFSFRNIDDSYEFALLLDLPQTAPNAVIRGNAAEGVSSQKVTINNANADPSIVILENNLPLDKLSYWFRALPNSEHAKIQFHKSGAVKEITESGWKVVYKDYMNINNYHLPEKLTLQNDNTRVEFKMVRGETDYLANPCPDFEAHSSNLEEAQLSSPTKAVTRLVPPDGSAPLPRWINKSDFCAQLFKLHGKIPDPKVGLYGPESMMWKLSGPLTPGGMGAGRALLLQTAHPWVTAGIDDHSIVRYDPMERARRTFVNVLTMVYGSMPQVMRSANLVHSTHEEIKGKMNYTAGSFKQGTEYRANEINAMIWVHATLWETLAKMYEEYEGPLTAAEKDQYYEETKLFAMLFGIPESALPKTWNDFMAYNRAMWNSPQLTVTKNARILKDDLFDAHSIWMILPLWVQEIVTSANLPPKIREGYGMNKGAWVKFNNAWLSASAQITHWLLPDFVGINALQHEAKARIKGKRVGAYHRAVIKTTLGTERLVN